MTAQCFRIRAPSVLILAINHSPLIPRRTEGEPRMAELRHKICFLKKKLLIPDNRKSAFESINEGLNLRKRGIGKIRQSFQKTKKQWQNTMSLLLLLFKRNIIKRRKKLIF